MTWAALSAGSSARLARRFGDGTATLTRSHSITDRDAAAVTHSVAVDGAHLAGASSLALKATDSGPLAGVIPADLVLTLAGTEYTVQAAAEANANAVTVTISPDLVADAANDDAVTLAASVTYSWPHSVTQAFAEEEVSDALIDTPTWRVLLPDQDKPTTPQVGDYLTVLGKAGRVVKTERAQFRFWDCLVGG